LDEKGRRRERRIRQIQEGFASVRVQPPHALPETVEGTSNGMIGTEEVQMRPTPRVLLAAAVLAGWLAAPAFAQAPAPATPDDKAAIAGAVGRYF
jgi:hypothetical protein